MKLEVLEGERQTSGEELKNKLEVMTKLNTELSTFKERVMNLTKENEVLEVKVLYREVVVCCLYCIEKLKFSNISCSIIISPQSHV